jgi:hypothetical protein
VYINSRIFHKYISRITCGATIIYLYQYYGSGAEGAVGGGSSIILLESEPEPTLETSAPRMVLKTVNFLNIFYNIFKH